MGPTISVSHWLDFWVLIMSLVLISKPQPPAMLFGKMLIGVFGSAVAAAWVGSGLVANMFRAKAHRREGHCMVAFGTGQPLGFYGSWPLFTLAHHNTVWLSAELVDPGSRFTAYAILGDDIVIGDAEVAAMSQTVVAIAKVQISKVRT